jgi:hypothetical protein
MFSGLYSIKLFEKIAASVHDGLDPLPEPPAGLRHGVPGQAGHHLLDLRHQGGDIVVGSFINISFTNAPYIIVERVAVRAAGRPDLLRPELREVLPAPILRRLAVVGRRPVLLEHVVSLAAALSIQDLTTSFRTLRYSSVLIFSPLAKMWGGITSPSLLTTPSTMTVVGNFVAITTGTSLMSAQSHLLFF